MAGGMQVACGTMVGQPRISLPSPFDASSANPAGTTAGLQLTNTGLAQLIQNGATTTAQNWVTPTVFAGSAYEGRFDVTSGTVNMGGSAATATWLSLGTTRAWGRTQAAGTSSSVTGTMQIRRASDLVVLASVSCTMTADGSP